MRRRDAKKTRAMPELLFYHHVRADGATRTGITQGDEELWHSFRNASKDSDPMLLWSVDLRCEGKAIPLGADGARSWLLDNAAAIRDGIDRVRVLLENDLVLNLLSLHWKTFPLLPAGTRAVLVCMFCRWTESTELLPILQDLSERWEKRLRAFSTPSEPEG